MKRLLLVIAALLCVFRFVADAQTNDCKPFDFNLAVSYQTSPNAYSSDKADINGDGRVDLVTANFDYKTVSVLFGDGAGGFLPPQNFPTEINITAVTAGDLNRDGKPDLVTAYVSGNRIAVLLNDNRGGFSAPTIIQLPQNVFGFNELKIADFDGDGNSDLAGIAETNLHIFLGNGQGGFALNTSLPWKGDNAHLVVANFNNDNLSDLAITSTHYSVPWEFGIMLGKSGGGFIINTRYSLPDEPSSIIAGEFNGDGLTDVVLGLNYPYQNTTPQRFYLQLWTGNGAGNFTAGTKIILPFRVAEVTSGDFNGDGKSDLAASLNSIIVTAYASGDGTFQNLTYWASPTARLTAADVNQDNRHDLLTIQGSQSGGSVTVLLSRGDEGFPAPKAVPYGDTDIAAADFNGDGLLDMVTANDSDFTSEVVIALNDSNKSFLPDRRFQTPPALRGLAVGDFNGDGKKDVVTAHSTNAKSVAIYLGDGAGNLAAPVTRTFSYGVETVVAGDFNGDRKDDLFVLDNAPRSHVLLSNSDGTFTAAPEFLTDPPYYSATPGTGDFNADGKLDLVVLTSLGGNSALTIWLGTGNGTFTKSDSETGFFPNIAVGDINADGKLDIVTLSSSGGGTAITRLLGDGNGEFDKVSAQTLNFDSAYLIVADFNSDSAADVALHTFSTLGNLVVIPSSNQAPFYETPVYFPLGGFGGASYAGYLSALIAADYNGDNKIDIGFTSRYTTRGVVYNANRQNPDPCLSINDVTVTEGDSGAATATFTVTLSAPSSQIVRFNYTLAGQNATLGTDLQNLSGRLEIPAGQTTATINVPIAGDLLDEVDETFVVNLSSATNAFLVKTIGVGTIIDNDSAPSLTITDVSQNEPDSFQGFNFRVNLSAPSAKPISFHYATADGTAVSGKDYSTATNTVNIQPGTAFADIWVPITSDSMHEPDETFFLNLSNPTNVTISDDQGKGTIVNNDPVPTLFFFVGGAAEGDTGLAARTINLQLSNPTYQLVTFSLATGDGTALKGKDYNSSNTTLVILAERMSTTTNVQIIGDTINEPNETFTVNLSNVSNATVTNAQAQITIIDDESVANDFDRDGKTDIPVFRPSDRNWYVQFSSTGSFSAFQYGLGTDVPVSGDYNNDGRTDYAVWRASTGGWYTPVPNRSQVWGKEGDVPVPGDYDNDGRIDLAVFRPAAKTWYVQLSSNNSFKIVQFGLETDKPVPADYDGDGKTDIAVFRPATGYWYILRSSDEGITSLQFGIETDQLVPADYDGDGRADIAVFRDGNWYYNRSSNDAFTAFKWGIAGDKPVPGNYDGDDKTDFAVYRNGNWYVWLSSTNSLMAKQFGLPDDVPIPFVSNN